MSQIFLTVVAPCYNEEKVLPEFYRRCRAVCENLKVSYEIVLVNDGSKDSTWQIMQQLTQQDSRVVAVNLARNHGQQLALTAGLSVCRGEHILIIDADLQDPPELLPQLLEYQHAGVDVVYGQRHQRKGESWFKKFTSAAFYRVISRLATVPIPQDTGDFRLITRRVLDVFLEMPEKQRFIRGMMSWIGFRQEAFLYDRDARIAGTTNYPFWKLWNLAVDAITGFSVKPLQFASTLGLGCGGIGLLFFARALLSVAAGWDGAGWYGLLGCLHFLAGVQLLALGIHGEYLGRIYEQSKERPLFVIDHIACSSPDFLFDQANNSTLNKKTRRAA